MKEHVYSYVESYIDVVFIDENEQNIFINTPPRLEIFFKHKRKMVRFFDPQSFAPYGYNLNRNDYSVRIFLDLPAKGENISYTYFKINGGQLHEFKTEYKIFNNENDKQGSTLIGMSVIRKNIWLDGDLIWDDNIIDKMQNYMPNILIDKDDLSIGMGL